MILSWYPILITVSAFSLSLNSFAPLMTLLFQSRSLCLCHYLWDMPHISLPFYDWNKIAFLFMLCSSSTLTHLYYSTPKPEAKFLPPPKRQSQFKLLALLPRFLVLSLLDSLKLWVTDLLGYLTLQDRLPGWVIAWSMWHSVVFWQMWIEDAWRHDRRRSHRYTWSGSCTHCTGPHTRAYYTLAMLIKARYC